MRKVMPTHIRVLLMVGFMGFSLLAYSGPAGYDHASLPPIATVKTASIDISPHDRLLIIAPHCDDETLAAGGVLRDAVRLGAKAYVAVVTNGDGFPLAADRTFRTMKITPEKLIEFGYRRQMESLEGLGTLGVPQENVFFLGYPDKGMALMWHDYWSSSTPYTSKFTKVSSSPYSNSYRPGATYSGEDVARDLESIILKVQPTIIFTASPVDIHPDHWGSYNFTLYAIEDLDQKGALPIPQPRVLWYIVHRRGWPYPRGFYPYLRLLPPKELIHLGLNWFTYELSHEAILSKSGAIRSYKSQISVMGRYLISFARSNELFVDGTPAPMPAIAGPGPAIDGRVNDWPPGIGLLKEPAKDVAADYESGGDFNGIMVGKGAKEIYLAVSLMARPSSDISYHIQIRAVDAGVHEGSETMTEFILRQAENGAVFHVLNREGTILDKVRAANQGNIIEVAIPLEMLGSRRSLFLGIESRIRGDLIDRTIWRIFQVRQSPGITRLPDHL